MNKSFDEIMEEYEPLLRSTAASFSDKTGLSRDEVYQTASLALHRAYLTYTDGRGVTFGLYAKICVRNACISEQRRIAAAERRGNRSVRAAEGSRSEPLPGFDRLDLASLTELEKKRTQIPRRRSFVRRDRIQDENRDQIRRQRAQTRKEQTQGNLLRYRSDLILPKEGKDINTKKGIVNVRGHHHQMQRLRQRIHLYRGRAGLLRREGSSEYA